MWRVSYFHAGARHRLQRCGERGVERRLVPDPALGLHRARIGEAVVRGDRAADDAVKIRADAIATALVDRVAGDTAPEGLFAHRCGRVECRGYVIRGRSDRRGYETRRVRNRRGRTG